MWKVCVVEGKTLDNFEEKEVEEKKNKADESAGIIIEL
jgi:hypothetical protein